MYVGDIVDLVYVIVSNILQYAKLHDYHSQDP